MGTPKKNHIVEKVLKNFCTLISESEIFQAFITCNVDYYGSKRMKIQKSKYGNIVQEQ